MMTGLFSLVHTRPPTHTDYTHFGVYFHIPISRVETRFHSNDVVCRVVFNWFLMVAGPGTQQRPFRPSVSTILISCKLLLITSDTRVHYQITGMTGQRTLVVFKY